MPQLRTARERDSLFEKVVDCVSDALAGFLFVGAIVLAILVFFVGVNAIGLHDTASTTQEEITQTFQQLETPKERQQLAESLLTLHAAGFNTGVDDITTSAISSNTVEELQRVRETGEVPNVTYEVKGFLNWFKTYGLFVLAAYLAALSATVFFGFQQTAKDRYYLMDLPWRKPWPYLLVVLTLPLGFVFYVVSAVRLIIEKKEAGQEEEENILRQAEREQAERERQRRIEEHMRRALLRDYDDDDDFEDIYDSFVRREAGMAPHVTAPRRRETAYQPVTQSMIGMIAQLDAPQAARRKYIAIRTEKNNNQLASRHASLSMQVTRTESDLRSAGQTIQELQRKLASDKAEVKKITHAIEARKNSETDTATADVEQEFDRILALSGVSSVGLVNDSIVIEVDAVIDHKRKQYDGGTWRIWFSAGDRQLHSKEIRSGVKESWVARHGSRGKYPDYLHHGGFCFGGRRGEIDSYIERGQYYEAIQLAVHCMQSVNEDNRSDISNAFKPLKNQKEVTV